MAKKTNKEVKKAVKEISKSKYFGLFLIIIFIMVAAFFIYCCVNPELYNKIMGLSYYNYCSIQWSSTTI